MEDQVISQQDVLIPRRNERAISDVQEASADGGPESFRLLLEALREQRGLTKADLAKRTGFQPSTITRFEQGSRAPDREAVLLIAEAMVLTLADRDRLLAAAGFRSVIWDDPQLVELASVMFAADTSERTRGELRTLLAIAIGHARGAIARGR